MEKFQWDLVAYEEVEEFPEMINHPNFTKPLSERKQRLNYWRPGTVVQKQAIQDLYLRRSEVCNQAKQYNFTATVSNYMNRNKKRLYMQKLEENDGIREFCEDPITKIQLGHVSKNEIVYEPETPYLEFLKINLKNDVVKQVTIKKAQGFGELLVYIGGLRFFLMLFFGWFGTYFSSRLLNGVLSKGLYIEKSLKGLRSDYNSNQTQNGGRNKVAQIDAINPEPEREVEVDTKGEAITDKFVKIRLTRAQMFFDPWFSGFDALFKGVQSFVMCKRRADIQAKARERIEDEFNVVKMMKRIRLANDLWRGVLAKEQQKLMQCQKSGVIDLDASDVSEVSSIRSEESGELTDNQSGLSENGIPGSSIELSASEDIDDMRQRMSEQEVTAKVKERLEQKVKHERRQQLKQSVQRDIAFKNQHLTGEKLKLAEYGDPSRAKEHGSLLNAQLGLADDEARRQQLLGQKAVAKSGLREIRKDQVTRKQDEQQQKLDAGAGQIQ